MAGGSGGIIHIPWYATALRSNDLEAALEEIAPLALRYGASEYEVIRYRDDRYKFIQTATFEDPADFERYWYGEDFASWRQLNSGFYQVPVLYGWTDRTSHGTAVVDAPAVPAGTASGAGTDEE